MYQKFDRKTDYAKAVVNLHNKRVLLAPDPVSKSTLLLCTINKNEYLSKYYLQFSLIVDIVYKYSLIASSILDFTRSAISGVFNCLYSS